jgi:hypothetical protein
MMLGHYQALGREKEPRGGGASTLQQRGQPEAHSASARGRATLVMSMRRWIWAARAGGAVRADCRQGKAWEMRATLAKRKRQGN